MALTTATISSGVTLLHHGLTHDCSTSTSVPAVLWSYLWLYALRCFSSKTLCTATEAPGCTCCSMGLSLGHSPFRGISAEDAVRCPAPLWTCPQITVPLIQVHTGVPPCPWPSGSPGALPLLLPKHSKAQQSDDQQYSGSKKQPVTSTRLSYTVRQARPKASTGACQLIAKQ